ncbi:threonylcarbamoyl-AMP synthase, putative [Hepatocystis sp. ex Piliocolobus tephrosceles]|nr:threonylcarbamoyl-AMP synthase, putative [Hepatocystis sp. ex Piliocolobus tephrosceles]
MARIIKGEDLLNNDDIKNLLKEHIKNNYLIGIPTETVYGLGGNSLSTESLSNIFRMKNRPTSDPIISHVYDISQAYDKLYHINVFEKYIIYILGKHFWPGPLSIIAKAKKNVPLILTAYTQFCAVRIPDNIIAKEIIKICDTPIAAPSANKFKHISPTNSLHVLEEFKNEKNLLIFDSGQCDIGIESTVIKITKYKHSKKSKKLSVNGNFTNKSVTDKDYGDCDVDGDDEVVTDCDYEYECNTEMYNMKKSLNCISETNNMEVYERLKNYFDTISMGTCNTNDDNNSYSIINNLIKYKNLYKYEIKIFRRGKYTKTDIERVLKNNILLNNIEVNIFKKIKYENLYILKNNTQEICTSKLDSDNMLVSEGDEHNDINKTYNDINKTYNNINKTYNDINKTHNDISTSLNANTIHNTDDEKNQICPGLMITHYSPIVTTYLIDNMSTDEYKQKYKNSNVLNMNTKKCIFLDIGGSFLNHQHFFFKYLNISYNNESSKEERIQYVTKYFFLFLRKAENVAIQNKAENIFISIVNLKSCDEHSLSIYDRIFRAASGKVLKTFINNDNLLLF